MQHKPSRQIKAILGLGNPGSLYQKTRHNIGHLFVDFLTNGYFDKEKLFFYKKISKDAKSVFIIAKTNVFMNKSGRAFLELKKKFSLKDNEILIAHDDSDIIFGKFKISYKAGSAGHKGIESILSATKKNNLWRLRFGIRPKILTGTNWQKAENFVLKNFSKKEEENLNRIFQQAKEKVFL